MELELIPLSVDDESSSDFSLEQQQAPHKSFIFQEKKWVVLIIVIMLLIFGVSFSFLVISGKRAAELIEFNSKESKVQISGLCSPSHDFSASTVASNPSLWTFSVEESELELFLASSSSAWTQPMITAFIPSISLPSNCNSTINFKSTFILEDEETVGAFLTGMLLTDGPVSVSIRWSLRISLLWGIFSFSHTLELPNIVLSESPQSPSDPPPPTKTANSEIENESDFPIRNLSILNNTIHELRLGIHMEIPATEPLSFSLEVLIPKIWIDLISVSSKGVDACQVQHEIAAVFTNSPFSFDMGKGGLDIFKFDFIVSRSSAISMGILIQDRLETRSMEVILRGSSLLNSECTLQRVSRFISFSLLAPSVDIMPQENCTATTMTRRSTVKRKRTSWSLDFPSLFPPLPPPSRLIIQPTKSNSLEVVLDFPSFESDKKVLHGRLDDLNISLEYGQESLASLDLSLFFNDKDDVMFGLTLSLTIHQFSSFGALLSQLFDPKILSFSPLEFVGAPTTHTTTVSSMILSNIRVDSSSFLTPLQTNLASYSYDPFLSLIGMFSDFKQLELLGSNEDGWVQFEIDFAFSRYSILPQEVSLFIPSLFMSLVRIPSHNNLTSFSLDEILEIRTNDFILQSPNSSQSDLFGFAIKKGGNLSDTITEYLTLALAPNNSMEVSLVGGQSPSSASLKMATPNITNHTNSLSNATEDNILQHILDNSFFSFSIPATSILENNNSNTDDLVVINSGEIVRSDGDFITAFLNITLSLPFDLIINKEFDFFVECRGVHGDLFLFGWMEEVSISSRVNYLPTYLTVSAKDGSRRSLESLISYYISQTAPPPIISIHISVSRSNTSTGGGGGPFNLSFDLPLPVSGSGQGIRSELLSLDYSIKDTILMNCRLTLRFAVWIRNSLPFLLSIKSISFDIFFDDDDGALCAFSCWYEPRSSIFLDHLQSGGIVFIPPNQAYPITFKLDASSNEICFRLSDEFDSNKLFIDIKRGLCIIQVGNFSADISFESNDVFISNNDE